MANRDPDSNTYTLLPGELNFALAPQDGDADVIGNGLDNILTGNDGKNLLVGLAGDDTLDGGTGADTLRGGLGDDVYRLAGGDDAIEGEDAANGGGDDTILSDSTIDLEDYPDIENLTLEGAADLDGFGNALGNTILGNTLDGRDGDDSLAGGLDDDHLIGGDGNDTLDGGDGDDQLDGGAGNDTYLVDGSEFINEGADEGNDTVIVTVNMDYTILGTQIENIVLTAGGSASGNDLDNHLLGSDLDDNLSGGKGNDTLVGGLGDDVLTGGEGNDTYYVDSDLDTVIEQAGEGNDTVIVTGDIDYTLVGTQIENLVLTRGGSATGNDLANRLTGGDNSNDGLDGGKGDDTLDGGGGADGLTGGEGNDTYYVDIDLDFVSELANQGYDRIYSRASLNLSMQGANVEYLELLGSANLKATGDGLANEIVGNSGSNSLSGLDGKDTLKGGLGSDTLDGGAGADDLKGGQGDDTYTIDDQDSVHEEAGEGRDTVRVGFAVYRLTDNVEDMTFTGAGNFAGTGNDQHNFIRGGAGNDTLAGGNGDDSLHGGAGADRMDGGAGSDLYWVDNKADVIVDSGVGFDRVLASADYTLGANLEYLAFEGSGNFSGTGNELDNTLYGNTGANTLDGGAGRDQIDGGEGADRLLGGAGDDTISDWKGDDVIDGGAGKDDLRGGVGNDTYLVDGLDLVTELAGQGIDTVTASESFALGASAEVEILMAKAGTNAINLTGSDTANAVSGNNGANALSGMGGDDVLTGHLGSDTLSGGLGSDRLAGGIGKDVLQGDAGADSFVFDSRITKADADKIVAYNPADDRILIENALVKANKVLYKAVGKGTEAKPAALAKKFFTIGSKAKDKDDFFILNTKKFTLSYDADGSGSKAAVVIATFDKNAMKKFIHKELFFI